MQQRTRNPRTASARTSLREALASLEAARARVYTLQELRSWREQAARRYVRPARAKHQA